MLVIGRNRWSAPGALRGDRIAHPIIRKTLALAKSLGPSLYLVSVGLIAIWVIGVFFGAGFLFLMNPHAKNAAAQLGVGSAHLNASSAETSWMLLSTTGVNELSVPATEEPLANQSRIMAAPDDRTTVFQELQLAARVELLADQNITQPDGIRLGGRGDGTASSVLDERLPGSVVLIEPAEAVGLSTGTPSQRPNQLRSAGGRKPPVHPPVQAIQDLLQKHSGLLK
jgi:hypothetical protein